MFNLFSSETKAYKSLYGKEFKEKYSKSNQPVLIDVRTAAEYQGGSIGNARNIDFLSSDFEKTANALDKNIDYLLFCGSGNRSAQACSMMAEQGFKVQGGIGAWPT